MATSTSEPRAPSPPSAAKARPGTRHWRVVVALLAALLVAEAAARVLVARGGPVEEWHGTVNPHHLEMVDQLAAAGGVDVLALGSSSVGAGLDPDRLEARLEDVDSAFSFWLSGPSMGSVELIADELVLDRLDPEIVVIGLTSRSLNDNGQAQQRHFDIMRRSPGGVEAFGSPDILASVDEFASRFSALVRYREQLRDPRWVLAALRGEPVPDERSPLAPSGMQLSRLDAEFRIRPEHDAQEIAALAGYEVGGEELESLRRLVRAVQERGSDVVLVDFPILASLYPSLHPNGMDDVRLYEAALAGLAEDLDVPVVWARDEEWPTRYFADANHLNGEGARRLTDMVAAEVEALGT